MKLFSFVLVLLMFSLILTDTVSAQSNDLDNPDETIDVLTLLKINSNDTVDDVINISDGDIRSNIDIWDDFNDHLGITGKLSASDLPPTAVYTTGGVAWVNTMFKLSPAFFMQGLSNFWIRCPFEWLSNLGGFNVHLYSMYGDDPNAGSRKIIEKSFGFSKESFDADPDSTNVKVVNYTWIGDESSFTYRFIYINLNCPLYSDNTYKISFELSRHPNLFYTQSDNGMNNLRWSSYSSSSFDPIGTESNISLSIDILGIYGLSDGIAGFPIDAGSDIYYHFIFDDPLTLGEYLTIFMPFTNSFNGSMIITGSVGFSTIEWFSSDPENPYIFFSEEMQSVTTTYDLNIYIHSNTSNYIWIRDLNYPISSESIPVFFWEYTFDYAGLFTDKIFFAPWITIQQGDGEWVNVILSPEYVYNYITETTYINYEIQNTLNRESIYYGVYKFGEYSYNALSWTWDKLKGAGKTIYALLPDTVKDGIDKIIDGIYQFGSISLDFGNWAYDEIQEIGSASFSVGLKAYEWIVEHIPSLQDLLSKLLRVTLAVTILALFTVVIYVMWKILNTLRILATAGLYPAVDYASKITLFQKAIQFVDVIT